MNKHLLDLNTGILDIIGDYVEKKKLKREMIKLKQIIKDKQIINGKEIRFNTYFYWIPYIIFDENKDYINNKNTITKDNIKKDIYLNMLIM